MQPSKRLTLLLVVSLALNLFLGGLVVGRTLFGPRHGKGPRDFGLGLLFGAERLLDPAGKAVSRETREFHRDKIRPKLRATRRARHDVAEALGAEPFDPEALSAALSRLRQETSLSQEALHEALVDLASRLTLEQREILLRANPKAFEGRRGARGEGPRGTGRRGEGPRGQRAGDGQPNAPGARPNGAQPGLEGHGHEHPEGTAPHEHPGQEPKGREQPVPKP